MNKKNLRTKLESHNFVRTKNIFNHIIYIYIYIYIYIRNDNGY